MENRRPATHLGRPAFQGFDLFVAGEGFGKENCAAPVAQAATLPEANRARVPTVGRGRRARPVHGVRIDDRRGGGLRSAQYRFGKEP